MKKKSLSIVVALAVVVQEEGTFFKELQRDKTFDKFDFEWPLEQRMHERGPREHC